MKIVQIGDIHVSESRYAEFEILLKDLADRIKNEQPDLIIFSGDLFIHRDRLTPNQVLLARKFFKEYLAGYKIISIVGNHDISMAETKADSLSAIFTLDDIQISIKIGEYIDINDYRFHLFPYPSKQELVRLGFNEVADFSQLDKISPLFSIDPTKKNVLIYHGVLEGFNVADYIGSEEAISVGKEVVIPSSFWSQFDATMAGHIHKFQGWKNAVYAGCPFPLTYADDQTTGFVVWEDLKMRFVEVPQIFPYITYNLGSISAYKTYTDFYNAVPKKDHTNSRIRIRYKIPQSQAGHIDHNKLASKIGIAKEIKIVSDYIETKNSDTISVEDFENNSIYDLILKYIDDKKFHPKVKDIAELIEERIEEKYTKEETRGIHFKINKLSLSNFKCFGENNKTIDFDSLGKVVGIFGPNKLGKSSLIESILWGLFGQTLRNKIANTVIRNGEETASVTVEFASHGEQYKIIRSRGKQNYIAFYHLMDSTWVDISGATATVTQKNIEKIVGTFDMFVSTVYSPQGGIDIIVKKKPNERKQIILDCLQVDVLERRQEEITEIRKQVKDDIANERGRVNAYTDDLTSLIAQGPHEALKILEANLVIEKTELTRLKSHHNSLSKRVYEYEDLHGENDRLTSRLLDIKDSITGIEDRIKAKTLERDKYEVALSDKRLIDEGIQRLREKEALVNKFQAEANINLDRKQRLSVVQRDIQQVKSKYDSAIDTLTSSRNMIMQSMYGLKRLDCPKPDCPMNKKMSDEVEAYQKRMDEIEAQIAVEKQLRSDEIAKLEELQYKIEDEINSSFYDKNKHLEYIGQLNREKKNDWEDLKNKIASGEDLLNGILELISSYMSQLESFRKERDSVVSKRNEIIDKMATIDRYKHEIEKVQVQIHNTEIKLQNYQNSIYKFKRDIDEINRLQKLIIDTQAKLAEKEEYDLLCKKYATIVSKEGVIFTLVDKALPILETFTQKLISETTNGLVSISLESQKTLSSGDKTDEVSIFISDSKGRRDILEGSGSEIVLVSLALRAAMAYLLSMRMGSKVELFILDESLGVFDEENIISIKNLIKKLGELFNKLLFITHVEVAKDVAHSVIELKSNGIVSTFDIKGAINA